MNRKSMSAAINAIPLPCMGQFGFKETFSKKEAC